MLLAHGGRPYKRVASGGADGAVLLHTLRTGRHLRTIRPATSSSSAASSSANASYSSPSLSSSFKGPGVKGYGGTPSWVCLVAGGLTLVHFLRSSFAIVST